MDDTNPISRRSVLQGLPLASVTASIPLLPSHSQAASADAHLFSLAEAWRVQYDAACAEQGDDKFDRLWALEREIATIRPLTVEGFAAKLLILTNFGEFDLDGPGKGLLDEAEAISGLAPPASFSRT